jgi:hypothetical protein
VRQLSKIDRFAVFAALVLSVQAPAFLDADNLYFNYVNNVQYPQVVYLYLGYIQLIPQAATYVLKFFPFIVQAIVYRSLCLLIILIFYWQLKQLFLIRCKDHEASLLSLAIIFFLRFVEPNLFATLSYTIWSAFLAASVHIIRIHAAGAHYSAIGSLGILVASLSQPLAVLLIPIFLISALRRLSKPVPNRTEIPVSIVISLLIAATYAFAVIQSMYGPEGTHVAKENYSVLKYIEMQHARWALGWAMADLDTIVSALVFSFRHHYKLEVVMIVVSVLLLVSAGLAACWRYLKGNFSDATKIDCMLSYLGLSSFALYLLSPRFLQHLDVNSPPFQTRYELVLIIFAAIASVFVVLRAKSRDNRLLLFGSVFGFCLALLIVSIFPSISAAQRTALQKYQFFLAAAEFRINCRSEEVFVYSNEFESPVILCKPIDLPPGFSPVTGFKTWTTSDKPSDDADDRPGIWSPRRAL